MRALSLYQPWASMIRLGIKTIETRFWSTKHRGSILICSTQKIDPNAVEICHEFGVSTSVLDDLGAMQCIVDITDCRLGVESDYERACCDLFVEKNGVIVQKYAFDLSNIVQVDRKPVKCGRKWFVVDDSLIERRT